MIETNIAGLQDFQDCKQMQAIKDYQTSIFPKFPLWERIKLLFKRHEHKWKLFKEKEEIFEQFIFCKSRGIFSVKLKAYKCLDCGEIKFWYSHDMKRQKFKQLKEKFEFEVLNGLLTN